jgi:hypothetical protein
MLGAATGITMCAQTLDRIVTDPSDSGRCLLDLVYEGPLEQTPWRGFLKNLRAVTNATCANLQLHCAHTIEAENRVFATHADTLVDWQAFQDLYGRKYAEFDPMPPCRLRPGAIATIEDYRGSLFHRDLLMPLQITHVVRTCFAEPGGMKCSLELIGHAPLGPFDAHRDITVLRELLSHLERALQLYARMTRARRETSMYQGALGRLAYIRGFE